MSDNQPTKNYINHLQPVGSKVLVRFNKEKEEFIVNEKTGLFELQEYFGEDHLSVTLLAKDSLVIASLFNDPDELTIGDEYIISKQPNGVEFDEWFTDEKGEDYRVCMLNVNDILARKVGDEYLPIGEYIECVEYSDTHYRDKGVGVNGIETELWFERNPRTVAVIGEGGAITYEPISFPMPVSTTDRGQLLQSYSIIHRMGKGVKDPYFVDVNSRDISRSLAGRDMQAGDAIVHGRMIIGNSYSRAMGCFEFPFNGDTDHFILGCRRIFGFVPKEELNLQQTVRQSEYTKYHIPK